MNININIPLPDKVEERVEKAQEKASKAYSAGKVLFNRIRTASKAGYKAFKDTKPEEPAPTTEATAEAVQ